MSITPPSPEWNLFAKQLQTIADSNRKAMEGLITSGVLARQQEIANSFAVMLDSIDFSRALQKQLSTADFSRALLRIAAETQEQREAISANLMRITTALDSSGWARVLEHVASVPIEVVADPEAALERVTESVVPELEFDTPDGVTAIPFIVARLTPARKRELMLSLLALVIATWLYIKALEANHDEFAGFASALLANFWLYSRVLSAIEDVEQLPHEEDDESVT